jgi:hypothetical protein
MVTGNPGVVMPVAGVLPIVVALIVALGDDAAGKECEGEQTQ